MQGKENRNLYKDKYTISNENGPQMSKDNHERNINNHKYTSKQIYHDIRSKCTYKNINYTPTNNNNKDGDEHNTNHNQTNINQHDKSQIKNKDMIRNIKINDFNITDKGKTQITEIPEIHDDMQKGRTNKEDKLSWIQSYENNLHAKWKYFVDGSSVILMLAWIRRTNGFLV